MMIREFQKDDYKKLFDMQLSKEDQDELQALTGIDSTQAVLVLSCALSERTFTVDAMWGGLFAIFGYTKEDNSVWLVVDIRARNYPTMLLKMCHEFLAKWLPENPPYGYYRNFVSVQNRRAWNLLAHLGAEFSSIYRTYGGLRLQEFIIYPGEVSVRRCVLQQL